MPYVDKPLLQAYGRARCCRCCGPAGLHAPCFIQGAKSGLLAIPRLFLHKQPGTPYDEIPLTTSLLANLKAGKPIPIPLQQRRRIFFIGGSILGALLSYLVFMSTKSYHTSFLNELQSSMNSVEFGFPTAGWADLANMLNMSDLLAPNARAWLENRDFKVGREAKAAGLEKKHAVMLIPGVISSVSRHEEA